MAGGFMMALGGALKGYGDATLDQMKADALAKREEALSQANFERQRLLAADTRQFQADEAQKQRDFTAGQDDKQRAFSTSEKEKDRAADTDYRTKSLDIQRQELDLKKQEAGDLIQTDQGPMLRRGTTAEPIKSADGTTIKVTATDKDKPADIATAEWLIQKGVAKNYEDAWTKVKQGVKADVQPADVEKMVETATKTELDGKFGVSEDEIQSIREKNRARIEKNLGLSQQKNGKPASGDQASTGKDEFIRQSRENAKAAIAAGKPRDQVLKRLEAAGVDTTGL